MPKRRADLSRPFALKVCSKCGHDKPPSEFHGDRSRRDGKSYTCNECRSKRARDYYAANTDAVLGRNKVWYTNNTDAHRALMRGWNRRNPEQVRSAQLKHKYGISADDYDRMLADQQGLCANPNCQNGPPAGRRLYVDHDHGHCPGKRSCGNCIRGLLCPSCNFALGNVSDDAERLRGLADYLESYVGSESTAGIC